MRIIPPDNVIVYHYKHRIVAVELDLTLIPVAFYRQNTFPILNQYFAML